MSYLSTHVGTIQMYDKHYGTLHNHISEIGELEEMLPKSV